MFFAYSPAPSMAYIVFLAFLIRCLMSVLFMDFRVIPRCLASLDCLMVSGPNVNLSSSLAQLTQRNVLCMCVSLEHVMDYETNIRNTSDFVHARQIRKRGLLSSP